MKYSIKHWTIIVHGISLTILYSIIVCIELSICKQKRAQYINNRINAWANKLVNFIKLSYVIHNPDNFEFKKNVPYIIMCNHASLYDIPLSFIAVEGKMRMLTKKELFKVPIWGTAMKMSGFLSIDRTNRRQAIKDLEEAKKVMKQGVIVWIAPEGTRSRDGKLLPFKKGGFRLAIETGATIVPLVFRGNQHLVEYRTFKVSTGKKVDIYIGKPIDASHYRIDKREKLLTDVRNQINSLMNQPD